MPIRFRCTYCNRLLGIATRKAGTDTVCPHCGYAITVPVPPDDDAKTERLGLKDVDELMGNLATERDVKPAPAAAKPAAPPKPRPVPPPVPKAAPKPRSSDDPPLFEGDVDELLGKTVVPAEAERAKPPRTSGPDALSLADAPRMLVLSGQKATLLMGGVVVLLALAFAAGYFLAR